MEGNSLPRDYIGLFLHSPTILHPLLSELETNLYATLHVSYSLQATSLPAQCHHSIHVHCSYHAQTEPLSVYKITAFTSTPPPFPTDHPQVKHTYSTLFTSTLHKSLSDTTTTRHKSSATPSPHHHPPCPAPGPNAKTSSTSKRTSTRSPKRMKEARQSRGSRKRTY